MSSDSTLIGESLLQHSDYATPNTPHGQGAHTVVSSPSEPAASSRTGRRPQPPGYAPTSGPYKMGELVREGMIRVDDELKYDGKENTSCRVVVREIGRYSTLNVTITYLQPSPVAGPSSTIASSPQLPIQIRCDNITGPCALEDAIAGKNLGVPLSRRTWSCFSIIRNGLNLGTLSELRSAIVESRLANQEASDMLNSFDSPTGTAQDFYGLLRYFQRFMEPSLQGEIDRELAVMRSRFRPELWDLVTGPGDAFVERAQGEWSMKME